MTTPLIYTINGNVPIDDLEYSTTWEDNEKYTKLIETYKFDGEVVRESVHILTRQNLNLGLVQGAV
jgi:hypothetical protein